MVSIFKNRSLLCILLLSGNIQCVSANNPVSLSISDDKTVVNVHYLQLKKPLRTIEITTKAHLEPADTTWITSPTEGEMYEQLVIPGARVEPGDILARVSSNPIIVDQNSAKRESTHKLRYKALISSIRPMEYNPSELIFQSTRIDAIHERETIVKENKTKGHLVTDTPGYVYKVARHLNTNLSRGEHVFGIAQQFQLMSNLDEETLTSINEAEQVTYQINTPNTVVPLVTTKLNNATSDAPAFVKLTTSPDYFAHIAKKLEWPITIKITQHAQSANLRIPHESIHVSTEDPNTWFVWIIDPDTHQLIQRSVKTSEIFSEQTTITEGLNGTEKLVIAAPPWVRTGMKASPLAQDHHRVIRP